MKKIIPIFFNENRLYFYSWLGWAILIIINLIAIIGFLFGTVRYGKFEELFRLLEMPFAWGILIVGTRSLGRDRELGLFTLYFTAPIKLSEFILGKFLSLVAFFTIILFTLLIYPLITSIFFDISWLTVLSGFTGVFFAICFFSAIALFASALSSNALISIVIGFGIWMCLSLLGSLSRIFDPNAGITEILKMISYNYHFNHIISGIFSMDDIIYFTIMSLVLIKLTESQLLIQTAK